MLVYLFINNQTDHSLKIKALRKNNIKETISAGGVVLNKEGEVLVCSQRGTSWPFPKGHIEPQESENIAARREIYE